MKKLKYYEKRQKNSICYLQRELCLSAKELQQIKGGDITITCSGNETLNGGTGGCSNSLDNAGNLVMICRNGASLLEMFTNPLNKY
jgi:hypothetical protein